MCVGDWIHNCKIKKQRGQGDYFKNLFETNTIGIINSQNIKHQLDTIWYKKFVVHH